MESIEHDDVTPNEESSENESDTSCSTLNDNINEAPLVEDVSIFCDICKEHIFFREVMLHRRIHKALSMFQLCDLKSLTFKILDKRRRRILQSLQTKEISDKMKILKNIDAEYSIIYNYLIYENNHQLSHSNMKRSLEMPHVYNHKQTDILRDNVANLFEIQFDSSQMDFSFGHRTVNSPVISHILMNEKSLCIVVATGIDGVCAKEYVGKNFTNFVLKEFETFKMDSEDIQVDKIGKVLEDTCVQLDKCLGTGLHDDVTFKSWSSCCVETVVLSRLINGNIRITGLNVGDGGIVVVGSDDYRVLSHCHSTKNDEEIQRINENGGQVSMNQNEPYLAGVTQLTQIIGGYGDMTTKPFQLPQPKCEAIEINPINYFSLVLVNRYVLKFLSIEDVVSIVWDEMKDNLEIQTPSHGEGFDQSDLANTHKSENDSDSLLRNCSDASSVKQTASYYEPTPSQIIARKIINAAVLSSDVDYEFGAVVFSFK